MFRSYFAFSVQIQPRRPLCHYDGQFVTNMFRTRNEHEELMPSADPHERTPRLYPQGHESCRQKTLRTRSGHGASMLRTCWAEVENIGTYFFYFQCFVTADMFLFSISIIPEDLGSFRRDLAFGCVKTRFKSILKIQILGYISLVGICHGHFPTQISFDIYCKEVLTMRNRFFILPRPEKLNFN